jgi:hypothetical protein
MMSAPCTYNGYQAPGNVYLHKLWSPTQSDTASVNVPIEDGDIIVYREYGPYPQKFNTTGHVNLSIGALTSNGEGVANIMLGYNCGSSYNSATGTVACVVTGSDNTLIGAQSGSTSVNGGFNTLAGSNTGLAVSMHTSAFGYRAGTEETGLVTSGAQNLYLNASGDYMHSTESGGCYIKPVRRLTDVTARYAVYYEPLTGEMGYYLP